MCVRAHVCVCVCACVCVRVCVCVCVCAGRQSVAAGMREVDGVGLLDYCRRAVDKGPDATAASDEEGDAEAE